jgi:uncharacterized membrane protein YgcG
MTTRTIPKTTFTVLVELVVLVRRVLPLPSLPLKVRFCLIYTTVSQADRFLDSKQARDLVSVLTEAKQQIDPRLHEMARYGGGGGGGGRWGGGRGRGRGGGGKFIVIQSPQCSHPNNNIGWTGGNNAPVRNSRW